jgi:hypothetical protein
MESCNHILKVMTRFVQFVNVAEKNMVLAFNVIMVNVFVHFMSLVHPTKVSDFLMMMGTHIYSVLCMILQR